ncbi:MAG: hypothetical protein ACR2KL_05835 [Nocardioidaceae bacterium]
MLAVPTSLLAAGSLLYATPDTPVPTSNLVNRELLAQVDASIADIERALARFPTATVDPDDLLVEAPSDVLYRDAYVWRRVKPKIRHGAYRAHTDDDPELWR